MKEKLSLNVSARTGAENVKKIRRLGEVPGIIYGNKLKNKTIKCPAKALHNTYVKAGENQLVTIEIEDEKIPCLIHAVSFEPVTGSYDHVDFYAVDMTKKVTTHVPVLVVGESPAVKTLGGVLVTVLDELEVSCLPTEIPESFTVNISTLENFHDAITVAQIKVSDGVTIKNSFEKVIVTVQEPRKEEVVAAPVPAEGAVPAEGEAAATGAEGAAAAPAAAGTPAKTEEKTPGKEKKK